MKVPTVVVDAFENIRFGLGAMWASFTPVVRASIISSCVSFVLGFGFAAWLLP